MALPPYSLSLPASPLIESSPPLPSMVSALLVPLSVSPLLVPFLTIAWAGGARAMQFCGGGGLSRPCPNVSGGTMRNGSVEATSPTSGKSPWCRLLPCLLRSPRSAPSPRTTLLHEPSAAVLGSGGCDLLPKDHHLHRCPARPPERRLWRLHSAGSGREHPAQPLPGARPRRSRDCLPPPCARVERNHQGERDAHDCARWQDAARQLRSPERPESGSRAQRVCQ